MDKRFKRHAHELGVPERELSKAYDLDRLERQAALSHMVSRHLDMSAHVARGVQSNAYFTTFSWPGPDVVEPVGFYAHLQPIYAAELSPGMTFRGRILRLRTLEPPVSLSGTVLACVDAIGDPVVVTIYNALPPNLPFGQRQQAAAQRFPAGTCVAILDPFFKIAADGTPAVRVDDPSKVIPIADLPPLSAADLQERGRLAFLKRDYRAAAGCYSDALTELQSQPPNNIALLSTILTNLSATHLALNPSGSGPGASLRYALAAARIALGTRAAAKPFYRMAVALGAIPGCGAAASAALAEALDRWQPPPSADELRDMQARVAEGASRGGSGATGGTTPGAAADQLRTALISHALGAAWEAEVAQEEEEAVADEEADGSDPQAAIAAAAAQKDAGTAACKAGKHAEALAQYRRALRILTAALPAAVLLSNRSACGLFGTGVVVYQDSCLDAAAALVLAPRFEKNTFRLAKSLQLLKRSPQALEACERGMRLCDGGSADGLQHLLAQLRS